MPAVTTSAILLSTLRYGETSKIVRLATREHGVVSAIAKGALRPRSRFGAALQPLSSGTAHLVMHEHRDLHLLTGFDLARLRVGLAGDVARFAAASALAEVMQRFGHPEPHPESADLLEGGLTLLEDAPLEALEPLALRLLWRLVAVLGFAPTLEHCARDGAPVAPVGPLPFSAQDGGALCAACAAGHAATRLPEEARQGLADLLDPQAPLPEFDRPHAAAHRRLLARYVQYHLAEGAELPALRFWERAPWEAP
ncbi:MAG TPA: DNA repair protein RecO [Gemmatimonadales bacterium]|nr:DNA repair protein RecO [Gemmatimonadales bacterium]